MEINNIQAKKLMVLAREGDQTAFDQLYKLFLVPIYRYIYLRIQDRQLSEDLTQTVFLKVYQSLDGYRDQGKPILSYFFTIARNAIIDHVRKEKNRTTVELSEIEQEPDGKTDIAKELDGKIGVDLLKKHIGSLSQEQQEVIVLKFLNDLTNKEISQILGKTEMAVRQLQCRGVKALKEIFRDGEK